MTINIEMKSLLEEKLGIKINNMDLFKEAFTHKSFFNENRNIERNFNERLEFLGDAVLELITTEFLFKRFQKKEEGILTAYRSSLVCGESLARIARELDLGEYLFLSKGEEKSKGREKDYILANVFEALLGAIYLDSGIENVKKILDQYLFPYIDIVVAENLHKDPKSLFQEIAQEKETTTPHFEMISHSGPDHSKVFEMGAFLKDKCVGKGKGSSKQKAEIDAAKNALETLGWD